MSGSSVMHRVPVTAHCPDGPLPIAIENNRLQTVVGGYGEAEINLAQGLYRARVNTGAEVAERYIAIAAGEDAKSIEVPCRMASVAPVPGMRGESPALLDVVNSALQSPPPSTSARILILVRRYEGTGKIDTSNLRLVFGDDVVADIDEWQADPHGRFTLLSATLPPGGYGLEWAYKWHPRFSKGDEIADAVTLSLWACAGWTTVVFLTTDPTIGHRPRMSGMHAQMRRFGSVIGEDQYDTLCHQISQLAMNGLHAGRALVPDDIVKIVNDSRFADPLLAIVAAQALLFDDRVSPSEVIDTRRGHRGVRWTHFDHLVSTLRKLLPDHPDVLGLFMLGKELRGDRTSRTKADPIVWPPMLNSAFRVMIDRDWREHGLILPGSQAEQASRALVPHGPWTMWSEPQVGDAADIEAPTDEQRAVIGAIVEKVREDGIRPDIRALLGLDVSGRWRDAKVTVDPEPQRRVQAIVNDAMASARTRSKAVAKAELQNAAATIALDNLRRAKLPLSSVVGALGGLQKK
ncbi:MAG: hypothetical protein AAFM91_14030 [Pseudomonadota bacterium]